MNMITALCNTAHPLLGTHVVALQLPSNRCTVNNTIQYNTIQYTLFNEGEHINFLRFSNMALKINIKHYKITDNLN